jgi:hypothetical protein
MPSFGCLGTRGSASNPKSYCRHYALVGPFCEAFRLRTEGKIVLLSNRLLIRMVAMMSVTRSRDTKA